MNAPHKATAYAAKSATAPFERIEIERRALGPDDVRIDIAYAGICHSDIHTARGEWGEVEYPVVPGHEIAGIITEVGAGVTKYQVGDRAGVGCFVDSCGECELCLAGTEQFCNGEPGTIWTYAAEGRDGNQTYGGYSTSIVVRENYVCRIPDSLPLEAAAPLMCAGITTYAPLSRWGAGPGKKVAVVGMGGLGHMAVKIAVAMGSEVHVISHTRAKEADALRFGAVALHASSEPGTLAKLERTFDLMITTVSAATDLTEYINCLKPFAALVDVGLPEHPVTLSINYLTGQNRVLAGSNIGGIGETQEMLDFCAANGITPQIEVIGAKDIDSAWEKVVASQARYRYVIDTATFTD